MDGERAIGFEDFVALRSPRLLRIAYLRILLVRVSRSRTIGPGTTGKFPSGSTVHYGWFNGPESGTVELLIDGVVQSRDAAGGIATSESLRRGQTVALRARGGPAVGKLFKGMYHPIDDFPGSPE